MNLAAWLGSHTHLFRHYSQRGGTGPRGGQGQVSVVVARSFLFFFLFFLFFKLLALFFFLIYLFIFGCVGSLFLCEGFL